MEDGRELGGSIAKAHLGLFCLLFGALLGYPLSLLPLLELAAEKGAHRGLTGLGKGARRTIAWLEAVCGDWTHKEEQIERILHER